MGLSATAHRPDEASIEVVGSLLHNYWQGQAVKLRINLLLVVEVYLTMARA